MVLGTQEAERALAALSLMAGDPGKGISGWAKTNAMAMTGATDETLEYVKALNIASASELTLDQKQKLAAMSGYSLAESVKYTTTALLAQAKAWVLSPLGKATIAAAAIFAIVKIIDACTVSLEESQEKLANLKEEYANAESELSSLNSELETTQTRLEELESKGALTFTEQEELENLKAQNRELQRSIELLELEQK